MGRNKTIQKDEILVLNLEIVDEIELYRNVILNPLSHSRIINITKNEVSKAINAVEKLEEEFEALKRTTNRN